MADWEIVEKYQSGSQSIAAIMNPGMAPDYSYWVKNIETGELKLVKAEDEYELGEKISEGDFEETAF